MFKGKKVYISIAILLLLSIIGISIYWVYISPKLGLFDDAKRAENFRSMQKIFPAKTIHRATNPYTFKENLQDLDLSYEFDGKKFQMADMLKRTRTTGILVVKNDTIVYEKYFQGNTKTDRNTSWSVAKSFISALIGIAIAEGHISNINDPITKYMPELERSGYRNVPIKHILQMSSGVKFSEKYDDPESDIFQVIPNLFFYMKSLKHLATTFPSERQSGKTFHYISLDTQILGMLIERVTGQSIAIYVEQKLWQPLGAESDAFWLTDNYNTELSFCCLNATLRDYAKFGLLYLHDGYFDGEQIVPQAWVKESIVPDSPHLQVGATDEKEYGKWGYQYQWWIPTGSRGDYSAVGILGQYIYIDPQNNVVIVKTSSGNLTSTAKDDDEAIALFRAISQELKLHNKI